MFIGKWEHYAIMSNFKSTTLSKSSGGYTNIAVKFTTSQSNVDTHMAIYCIITAFMFAVVGKPMLFLVNSSARVAPLKT